MEQPNKPPFKSGTLKPWSVAQQKEQSEVTTDDVTPVIESSGPKMRALLRAKPKP